HRYLRNITGAGEEFYSADDPTTGLYPFTAVNQTVSQDPAQRTVYSTTPDPQAGVLYADLAKTIVLNKSDYRSFEPKLVRVTDGALAATFKPLTVKELSGGRATGASITLQDATIGTVVNAVSLFADGQISTPVLTVTSSNGRIDAHAADDLVTGNWKAAKITAASTSFFDFSGTYGGGDLEAPISFTNSSGGAPSRIDLTSLDDLTLGATQSPTTSMHIVAGGTLVNAPTTLSVSGAGNFIEISAGGDLNLTGPYTASGPITFASLGLPNESGVRTGGTVTVAGNISSGAGLVTIDSNDADSRLSGVVSGSGGLTITGGGTVLLAGSNTYTGRTSIVAGTLRLKGGGSIGSASTVLSDSTDVNIAAGATLDLNGYSETFDGLSGAGTLTNSTNATITATIGANNDPAPTFSGVITDGAGRIGVTKTGAGVQTLSAAHSYTGPTNINAGTLVLTGSIAAGSTTTVSSGARLQGASTT
ncbi:MAG TPA: autotransporter-associated beta strand repeat-containing protein, partial [Pirellulaceae bacterium]|nr:autotransporter-associated beta strand repeat-containing protein [Pirellulaceae bacterium]